MPEPEHHQTEAATAQLARFSRGVSILGGKTAAAAALGCTDRTVRDLVGGKRTLHAGFLRDMAAALGALGLEARELERQLNPLFTANLPPADRGAVRDSRRHNAGLAVDPAPDRKAR